MTYVFIKVKQETRHKMLESAKKIETYDDYINRLMNNDREFQR